MGRYDEGSLGFFPGLSFGIICAFFQCCGIKFSLIELLKMFVRCEMALFPKCLRWMFEMLSGPVAGEDFNVLIVFVVSFGVRGSGGCGGGLIFLSCLIIFLFAGVEFCWLCLAKCDASKLTCCLVVEGEGELGFVMDSWVCGGLFFLLNKRFTIFQILLLLGY